MNPYYNPEQLDLELLSFEEPGPDYEFNTLCFWATKDGRVYTASDSGCSCPTPFEFDHDRATIEEVIQTLERVGSVEQALSTFDSWAKGYGQTPLLGADKRRECEQWVTEHLKAA